jgi:hypothetical protein
MKNQIVLKSFNDLSLPSAATLDRPSEQSDSDTASRRAETNQPQPQALFREMRFGCPAEAEPWSG